MILTRKRDLSDEAASFAEVLLGFLSTLGDLVRNTATWLGVAGLDAVSQGADAVSRQAGEFSAASKAQLRVARKRGRRALFKVALLALLLWWLDRDLSSS